MRMEQASPEPAPPADNRGAPAGTRPAGGPAAVFVLAVLLAPVLAALAWGRLSRPARPWPIEPPADPMALAPPMAPGQSLDLGDAEQQYLVELLFDSLKALAAGGEGPRGEPPPARDAPPECTRELNAALFATLYLPGQGSITALARAASLVDATRLAAQRLAQRPAFAEHWSKAVAQARARLDIVTEQADLSIHQCEQLYEMDTAEPFGLALAQAGELYVFLPADLAGPRADSHAQMLDALCREASLGQGAWRTTGLRMSLLRAVSFANIVPGGSNVVEVPQGLPVVHSVGPGLLRHSCRLAADYIARRWDPAGGGPPAERRDAATGRELAAGWAPGPGAAELHARCAAALARWYERSGDPAHLAVAEAAMAWLLERVRVLAAHPDRAHVAPERPGAPASLTDAAAALELCCAQHLASGGQGSEDLILRLGWFLLALQREDGGFHAGYDESADAPAAGADGEARPAAAADEANAARALVAAYKAVKQPEFLLGAQKALGRLAGEEVSARSGPEAARRFVVAVWEYGSVLPADPYLARVADAVAMLARRQLSDAQAPVPDLAGGAAGGFAAAGETEADLEAFSAAWLLAAGHEGPQASVTQPEGPQALVTQAEALRAACRRAAPAAGRYVMQFQCTPLNSYYLMEPLQASGGVRMRPGSNMVRIASVGRALDGLALLSLAMELDGALAGGPAGMAPAPSGGTQEP